MQRPGHPRQVQAIIFRSGVWFALVVGVCDVSAQAVRRATPAKSSVGGKSASAAVASLFSESTTSRAGDTFELSLGAVPAEADPAVFNKLYTIRSDGVVNVPYAGPVKATGLTQSQLETAIRNRFIDEKIFRWPTITINVPERTRLITVGDQVRAPSRVFWSAGNAADRNDNLLVNASFEKGTDGWQLRAFASKGQMAVDLNEKHGASGSLRIENSGADDTFVGQKVVVKPPARYRLTGWIKTKDVTPIEHNGKEGASLSLFGSFEKSQSVVKTKGWTRVTLDFDTGSKTEVEVGPRLGHHASKAIGTAWFADLSLVELGPARH